MKNSFLKKLLFFFVLSFLMLASFTYGIISVRRQHVPYKIYLSLYQQKRKIFSPEWKRKGIWHRVRNSAGDQELTEKQREAIAKISALPYLKGYRLADGKKNITVYNKDAVYNGVNLIVSGHAPEVLLIDMQGTVLHRWRKNFDDVWPGPLDLDGNELYKTFWNRAHLFSNGDLLAIFRDYGLIKLDKNSNVLWAYQGRCHHDLFVAEDKNIYVLSREVKKSPRLRLESWAADAPILEDFIVILNQYGEELNRVSVLDCFLNSHFAPMLEHIKVTENILHANAIEMIDGTLVDKYPMFKKGHILISLREIHTIAIIDLEQERVTWALTGKWKYQHEPSLLENGNLLVFDNRGNNGKSKVIEFNPLTQEVVWAYKGTAKEQFFSMTAGTTQRLPNGNTLITESNNGRAFEVTPEGKIVWEFYNPNRTGENNKFIAALYDVIRLDQDYLDGLTSSSKIDLRPF